MRCIIHKELYMKLHLKIASFKHLPLLAIILIAGLLRLPFLGSFPPSLHSDEVSQGYNAYSILKTGRDEHGTFLPTAFRAYGEWKPALPIYAMVPTIALFGLNGYGVRLPSALAGVGSILLIYFFVKLLLAHYLEKSNSEISLKQIEWWALSSALFLALSPWHIYQSRSALHNSILLLCMIGALTAFYLGLKKEKYLLLSGLCFSAVIYSYFGTLLIVAGILLLLLGLHWKDVFSPALRRYTLITVILAFLALVPLLISTFKNPDILFSRAKYVSIFYDQGVALRIWEITSSDPSTMNPLLARFFHNKLYFYSVEIFKRIFQHTTNDYVFITGDTYPPFQIPNMGIMYVVDGILLALGLWVISKRSLRLTVFSLFLSFIALIPSSLTFLTPSMQRTFMMIIPSAILIGAAGSVLYRSKLRVGLIALYSLCVIYFLYQYTIVLPKEHADWWHAGLKEVMQQTAKYPQQNVYISEHVGMPYMFLLFYQQIDPQRLRTELVRKNGKDVNGFEHVERFANTSSYEKSVPANIPIGSLIITGRDEPLLDFPQIYSYRYPNGDVGYHIYQK